jgi:dienelactone hydrolase
MVTGAPARNEAPTWSAEDAATHRRSVSSLTSDGRRLFWLESRPDDGGRQVVVVGVPGGPTVDVSPPQVSVRSRVHEYGGGAYCLLPGRAKGTALAYVDQHSQRVHLIESGVGSPSENGSGTGSGPTGVPVPLGDEAPDGEVWRHGDLRASPSGRWVLCVRERLGQASATRELVAMSTEPSDGEVIIVAGRDFVAAPRLDPTERWLAWVAWDHPDMPWDSSEVWVGEWTVDDRGVPSVSRPEIVAGGRGGGSSGEAVSVGQPTWCTDGALVFVSDAGGWWQLWRRSPDGTCGRICDDEAEFHMPDWQLGQSTVAELSDGRIATRRRRDGFDAVGVLDPDTGRFAELDQPCVSVTSMCRHRDGLAWLGASPWVPTTAWWCADIGHGRPPSSSHPVPVVGGTGPPIVETAVSVAVHFSCPSADPGRTVHGLFYGPRSAGPGRDKNERPPLVVVCHGGPTGSVEAGFDPVVQLLTTNGYAVAAVDYAGSAGYGRAYRRSLEGRWGEADVDDCVAAARALAAEGRVDGARMAVRGASAGGFTALCALFRAQAFAGAVSWYGVTDLETIVESTHDFESRYVDRLVGVLPDDVAVYRARSPRHRVADMTGSVLILQGLDDPVVPAAQASGLVEALEERGIRCDHRFFEGEGHGFRRAETLVAAFEAELRFYREVLGPTPR